jgi:hypothetical protein
MIPLTNIRGKDVPNIVFMPKSQQTSQHGTKKVNTHKYKINNTGYKTQNKDIQHKGTA